MVYKKRQEGETHVREHIGQHQEQRVQRL
jgi:hypothetical protein